MSPVPWRRRKEADQAAGEADQTSADQDQTASDADQNLSDRDQGFSEVDQAASDRDQELADQEFKAHPPGDADDCEPMRMPRPIVAHRQIGPRGEHRGARAGRLRAR